MSAEGCTAAALHAHADAIEHACLPCRHRQACLPCRHRQACLPCRHRQACLPCRHRQACLPCRHRQACLPCRHRQAAGLGGWLGEEGVRRALSSAERAQWARDAAAIREAAYQVEAREGAA